MAQESAVPSPPEAVDAVRRLSAGSALDRLMRRTVLGRLGRLAEGELAVVEAGAARRFGRRADAFPLRAEIEVLDPGFYRRLALGGSIGAGTSYADGMWRTPDLTSVMRVLARNREALSGVDGGLAALQRLLHRAIHRSRVNTRRGSRRNIAAHYDLGNEFFATFLDPTMTYSAAVFPRPEASLEEASREKLDLVCRKLALEPGDEVVEIGTGWGSFALHAAGEYGCRVTTTTISRRQHELASERVAAAGLGERVEILRCDYRDLPARLGRRFSKLVSIEMIEAVGHRFLPRYFGVLSDLLRPDGLALIQAILIPDQRYAAYRRSIDFIQHSIFPGGLVPSLGRIQQAIAEATDLQLVDLQDLTAHYARTLARWRRRFLAASERLEAMGLPASFRRLWEFYFCYCEGGFRERLIGDAQLLLAKPLNRREPLGARV